MKKLLFILMLAPVVVNAQNDKYFLGLDSASFVETFGTKDEYLWQKGIKEDSWNGRVNVFCGSKSHYLNDISIYLQERGYRTINQNYPMDELRIKLANKYNPKDGYVLITGKLDFKTNRIKTVTITGTPDELIDLFIFYWFESKISANRLKKGGYLYQDFISDRVTFDWKGVNPVIRILQNPENGRLYK